MERTVLPSPRQVNAPDARERAAADSSVGDGLRHESLAGPNPVRRRLRHFFKPATGWFRKLERNVSHVLSRDVYPRVPGLSRPYSRQLERRLTLSEAEVGVRGLPPSFAGLRLLLIADPHIGPFVSPDAMERIFSRLVATEPDLIVVAGDVMTADVREFPPFADAVRLLRAPLGVFGVLGNHDHYTKEPGRIRSLLEDAGIRVLHNTAASIDRHGDRLVLVGIDDLHLGQPDLDAALTAANELVSPGKAPRVLVSHNPDILFEAAARDVSLVLSGHTHGGQIRVPGLGVLVRQSQCYLDEGRYTYAGTELVVTRGLGVTGVPLRWHCPPEAILLTLTPK
jgi:predicted MPP superfamily phosphohydrolase